MFGFLRRAVVVAGLLLLVQPVQAVEVCEYSCAMIRWGAKNLSKETIRQVIAKATPGQLSACRKCLTTSRP